MSFWQQHNLEGRVISILEEVPDAAKEHHLGRPYLTAYQIAIEFAHRHPEIVAELGHLVGGVGTGEHYSLSSYMARRLSDVVKVNPNGRIEGGFLSNLHLQDVFFDHQGETIQSSLTSTQFTLSMFRLRD